MDRQRFERWLIARTSRRTLLTGGGALVAVSLAGRPTRARQSTPTASPVAAAYPFTLGVASGDPTADGVVLWTRLAPEPLTASGGMASAPVAVRWEVADDEAFGRIVAGGEATAAPDLAHSVHVDAAGLEPGREYFYRFLAGGEASPVGRMRTAPPAGTLADRFRFALASCQHYEDGFFTAYRHMAAEDLDAVFFVGDYIYEYAPEDNPDAVRRHEPAVLIATLDDYRIRHAQYKTDPDLQAAHAACPWIVTWDDHEVENDYANDRSENGDPPELFLEKRAAAYRAYYEHLPLRPEAMPLGPTMRLYRRLAFGDLAGIHVLDTRQYRTDHPCGEGAQVRCPAALDPRTTMLGPEQEAWLLAGLDAATARWNVIAQQVQFHEFEQAPGPAQLYWGDSWPGYPAARARIIDHLVSRRIANPVVLTGDIHTTWIADLKADWTNRDSATVGAEFIATSISSEGDNPSEFFRAFLPENPHVKFFDGRHGGYLSCEVTPDLWRTDVRVLTAVAKPDMPIATIASYAVEAGNPGVVPA